MADSTAFHVITELFLERPARPDEFHERIEGFMDQLVALEENDAALSDASVGGDASTGQVTVDLIVFTTDPLDAIVQAACATRTALHVLGDSTHGWPGYKELEAAFKTATTRTEPALITA